MRPVIFIIVVFDSLYYASFCLSNIVILASFLGHLSEKTTLCLCWKSVLSFTGNLVGNFVKYGKVFFKCFFILDSNWCPCFPEYRTNSSIFCSVSWFLVSTASTSYDRNNSWSIIWFMTLSGWSLFFVKTFPI